MTWINSRPGEITTGTTMAIKYEPSTDAADFTVFALYQGDKLIGRFVNLEFAKQTGEKRLTELQEMGIEEVGAV